MKTLTDRLGTLMTAIAILSVVGFFASEVIWFEGSQAYAGRLPPRGALLECPGSCDVWEIYLDDYGYSDYLGYNHHGVPLHEMLSGEWASAIKYKGIESWPQAMWLTHDFICPDWTTNSNFQVITPMGPTGVPNQVSSVIQNPQVQIRIVATMYCSRTAMGITPDPHTGNFVESDSCFMVQDYIIRNITSVNIESLYFCQFLHGHPGDNYGPVVTGVYDSDFYPIVDPEFPNSQNYHYDITQWSDTTWDGVEYREYVGFGAIKQPTTYDNWHYRSPDCSGGRPANGLHVRQEENNLQNVSFWGPDQTAGAEEWYFGTLPSGDSVIVSVLLSVAAYPHAKKEVSSSRLSVTFDNIGNVGEPDIIWDHPLIGPINAGHGGSIILGDTDPANLAVAYGETQVKYVPAEEWTQDWLYFKRTIADGDDIEYAFERHYTRFLHPTLPLEIELLAIGAFDPGEGPCEDAVFVKYVIHNYGEIPLDTLEKAFYLDLDIPPNANFNAVNGAQMYSTIWAYEVTRPDILFGMTQKPVYEDGGACGGRGISQPVDVYPQSGFDCVWLKEVMEENAWLMDPYGDQPTDVGIMLIDHEFSLLPLDRYCNEYIIWAYDKDDPVNGLTLGRFLYELMKQEGYYRGDVNCDGICSISDAVYLIVYLFRSGNGPLPFDDQGDVNCDGAVTIADVVYLISYLFRGGPPPIDKNRFFDEPYKTMFSRPGLVNDPVWRNLPSLVDP